MHLRLRLHITGCFTRYLSADTVLRYGFLHMLRLYALLAVLLKRGTVLNRPPLYTLPSAESRKRPRNIWLYWINGLSPAPLVMGYLGYGLNPQTLVTGFIGKP